MSAVLADAFDDVEIVSNQDVVDSRDIVWLCLMASVAEDVLAGLRFWDGQAILSAMVYVPHGALQQLCVSATDISMTIPMPFIALVGCPLPVYSASAALEEIFGARNIVIPVESERALNAYFGGLAQVAAGLAQMREGAVWLGEQTGDPVAAEAYIAAKFAGSLAQMPKDEQGQFDRAINALNTQGGLNTAVRTHLRDTGALRELRVALDGLKVRLGLN